MKEVADSQPLSEVPHKAPADGTVRTVYLKEGQDGLDTEQLCVEIE